VKTHSSTRIALYLPSLRGGGAERILVLLANRFASRGYSVDLVLATMEGPYLKDVASDVRVVDLKARRVSTSLLALVRYLRRERPAALLSAMGHANVIAVLACQIAGVSTRVIVSEHNNFSRSRFDAKTWRGRMMGHFMRWAYPRADAVVAVSAGVAEDLAKNIGLSGEQVTVVYNPVDIDTVLVKSRSLPDHPWFKPGELPVILGVGRLVPQKDFPVLMRAFACLRQAREARLLILGEGELRPQLEMLAAELGVQDDVCLPGFVDNPFAYMSRSVLFVLSSAWEGFGNVLVEAMACGAPVVSTACPSGPDEILENGHWGHLVPVGDEAALAEAMAAALDEEDHPDVGARAAEFSVDRAVEGYLRVMLPAGDILDHAK
jgi:glycosyltransferase involved in cell wall biosynthesis